MPRYFVKELASRPLYGRGGRKIEFDFIGDDYGALATDDSMLIMELEYCIASQRGGVRESTADEIEELKKKHPINRLPQDFVLSQIRLLQQQAEQQSGNPAAGVKNQAGVSGSVAGPAIPAAPKIQSAPLEINPLPPVMSTRRARRGPNASVETPAVAVTPAAPPTPVSLPVLTASVPDETALV